MIVAAFAIAIVALTVLSTAGFPILAAVLGFAIGLALGTARGIHGAR